jgi:hypothetical protein
LFELGEHTVDAGFVFERVLRRGEGAKLMSVPEANALSPAPWSTSTLIARSRLASSQIAASRSYIAKVKAFRACGRLNVIRPMPSRIS